MSKVIELLDLVYDQANMATGHSWERLNHAMRQALTLAIGAGFEFAEGDFHHVATNYRSGSWLGESMEWCYALAVTVGNKSAWLDYEAYRNRGAFIADDVDPGDGYRASAGYNHMTGKRAKERLAVGFTFLWLGAKATVTSFAADGQSLIACTYQDPDRRKIAKRYAITREDFIRHRADAKRRKELAKSISAMDKASREAVLHRLGVKTQADFDALPVAKIEKALA